MGFWDSYDTRYKQARRLAIACAVAVIMSIVGVALLFLTGDRTSSGITEKSAEQDIGKETPIAMASFTAQETNTSELQRKLREAIATRELDTAAAVAADILKLKPKDSEALSCLAWIHEQKGSTSEALNFYTQAIDSSSDNKAYYLFLRAGLRRKMNDHASAITDMKEAARLDPGSIGMNNLLMIYQIEGGQAEEVRRTLAGYQAADLVSQRSHWLLGAAALALRDGDFSKAAQFFISFESLVPSALFTQLTSDPYFDVYREDPALQRHFFKPPHSP